MPKDITLNKLFNNLDIIDGSSISDFKKCFVHISVYDVKINNKNPGNSRYVFLGMYGFKGDLSILCMKYIAGNGKQLQHFLGNSFSNDSLAKVFDFLGLYDVVTIHSKLDFEKLKHIFALAYLGFVKKHCSAEFIEKTAYEFFIKPNGHYIPKVVSVNAIEMLKAKAEQILKGKVKIIQSEKDNLKTCQILLQNGLLIGEHQSISKLYAKKKAVKNALKYVLEAESESPAFKAMILKQKLLEAEKAKKEKALKQKKHQAYIEQKRIKRLEIKEIKRTEAKERDIRRTINKQNANNKKKAISETKDKRQ